MKISILLISWIATFTVVAFIQNKSSFFIKNKFILELISFVTGIAGFAVMIFLIVNLFGERNQPKFDDVNKPYHTNSIEYDSEEIPRCYGGNICD